MEDYQVIKKLNLDLVNPGITPVVSVPQYDQNGRVIEVTLYKNNEAYTLPTGTSAVVVLEKSDGTSVNNPCVVDGSKVYIVVTAQMTPIAGDVKPCVSVINIAADLELKTFPFVLRVMPSPSALGTYASTDEHLAFEELYRQMLAAASTADAKATAAAGSASAAETAASNASGAATAAAGSATAANTAQAAAATSATNAGQSATAASGSAANAAGSATTATEKATASAGSAAQSAASMQGAQAALAGAQAIVAGNEAYTKAEADAAFLGVKNALALFIKSALYALADPTDAAPLCEAFFDSFHDGKVYGVEFYKHATSATSAGWKTDDNAGLVATPSTNTTAGRDDYTRRVLFMPFDVDYTIDAETLEPKISAIKGVWGNFNAKAPAGLVGVMQQTGWIEHHDTATTYGYKYADKQVGAGWVPLEAAVKAADNSVRPFVIHAKYVAGYGTDGKLGSLSGVPAAIRTISHNSQIALWQARGAQYCGKSYADGGFVDLMLWLKYADKANTGIMTGCVSYYLSYPVTVAEAGVKRVIIAKANAANLVVGSSVNVGTSDDRGNAASYSVCNTATILSIEDYDANNSAVNLELDANITTTTANKISTIQWKSGGCNNVLGVDGSPTNPTSGKEPFIIQGIECMVGAYEVYADAIFSLTNTDGVFKITPYICKKASEITNNAIGAAYTPLGFSLTPPTSAGWRYISGMGFDPAHPCANFPDGLDASSNNGYKAGFYSEAATTGLREWLAVGVLGYGALDGLACACSSNWLGSANWIIAGRACGTAGNRGEFSA